MGQVTFTYTLTQQEQEAVKQFADAVYASGSYEYYIQRWKWISPEDFKRMQIEGKMSEFAACRYLQSIGYHVSEPDMTIYTVAEKSYAPDLVGDGYQFHVKGCRQSIYDTSWVFILNDEHIFNCSDGYVGKECLFCITYGLKRVEVAFMVDVEFLHTNKLFKEMQIAEYKKSKRAVYENDLAALFL